VVLIADLATESSSVIPYKELVSFLSALLHDVHVC
jgi:hypothetical protein